MRPVTSLVRIRFSETMLRCLDELVVMASRRRGKKMPRAAVVRALVQMHAKGGLDRNFDEAVQMDPVRRGRERKN